MNWIKMMTGRWRMVLLISLFICGVLLALYVQRSRIRLGEHTIYLNPLARVSMKKTYQLQLWDYNWPMPTGSQGYRTYLNKAIKDFQKEYPNIRVRVTLLEWPDGLVRLRKALEKNTAPDIYAAAYTIPAFDYHRQIPVGPFLKQAELENYFPELLRLHEISGILCYLPRWSAPGIWIGNRSLMEKANLDPNTIKNNGWNWSVLNLSQKRVPTEKYLICGNLANNGFITQMVVTNSVTSLSSPSFWSGSEVSAILETLSGWRVAKKVPDDIELNMVGNFLGGRSLLLAGVRPAIYRFIKDYQVKKTGKWEAVLLPAPYLIPNRSVQLCENGAFALYRNRWTKGDDQLAAAARLAHFLSVYPHTDPWQQQLVVPAARETARVWQREAGPLAEEAEFLISMLTRSRLKNFEKQAGYQEQIYPVLREYCRGTIDLEEAEEKLNQAVLIMKRNSIRPKHAAD